MACPGGARDGEREPRGGRWGVTALHHATEGIRLCRHLTHTQPLAAGLATLAFIRHASGNPAGAAEAIEEAKRVSPSTAVTSLLSPVSPPLARLLLAQGDVDAAARWAMERGLRPEDEPSYPREMEHLVLARVLLAQDLPDQALELLWRLHTVAAEQNRTGSLIEIQALRALARAAGSNENAALDTLAEALALAHPQGYIRVFVDEGAPMAALLGRFIATHHRETAGVPASYIGRLVRAFEQQPGDGQSSTVVTPGLVAQLSDRELEVLRLLATGKRNQEIADELYVAVDTVKKHVTHLLGKLGAANRTEATVRARELGLLP